LLIFSLLPQIIGHGSLRLDTEDSLSHFISQGTETNRKMFGLLEFVRFQYCSMDVTKDFCNLLSEYFCEINASMWASLRARLIVPHRTWKQFPPSVKQREKFDVPDGIIAHLMRECGGKGRGVPKDEAEATQYYKLAADQSHVWAQFHYAVCFGKGETL
jgi:hypothetical protein